MQYILIQTFETPCFTIRHGVSKTEEEWMDVFPKLQKGDCKIKNDWFIEDQFHDYTLKTFKNGEETQLPDQDYKKFLFSILRKLQYNEVENKIPAIYTIKQPA